MVVMWESYVDGTGDTKVCGSSVGWVQYMVRHELCQASSAEQCSGTWWVCLGSKLGGWFGGSNFVIAFLQLVLLVWKLLFQLFRLDC